MLILVLQSDSAEFGLTIVAIPIVLFLLVFAGSDTGGNVLSSGLIRILDNPGVHRRLKQELQEAWPSLENKPRYEDLEKLPYLVCPRGCQRWDTAF